MEIPNFLSEVDTSRYQLRIIADAEIKAEIIHRFPFFSDDMYERPVIREYRAVEVIERATGKVAVTVGVKGLSPEEMMQVVLEQIYEHEGPHV